MKNIKRSKQKITMYDLCRLLELARTDINKFFDENLIYKKPYKGQEKLVALCQGAALHYIDKKNGVKDFDVWFFYPQKGDVILPYRRTKCVDFGKSKFGKHPNYSKREGRGVDVLMRSTKYFNRGSPEGCITDYLSNCKTKTARLLAQKAVIGLYPEKVFGKVLWPLKDD
jgi:hypothetical protein